MIYLSDDAPSTTSEGAHVSGKLGHEADYESPFLL
jgi:hypothetical protein